MKRVTRMLACAVLAGVGCAANLHAQSNIVESATLSGAWGVWTGWFWPFDATEPPNLFADDEALSRFDALAGSYSQSWEYTNHGPVLNEPEWTGHCHAWAGASVWEAMPTADRTVGGVNFRARDQAALMTEAYYNDTLGTEISIYRPSPGIFWRYLRQEIGGQNSMHGHAMGLIGNLTTIPGEVWNFPIYAYEVNYTQDISGACSGFISVSFADDGSPGYADSLGLSTVTYWYAFTGVQLDGSGNPLSSGAWAGSSPSQFPTAIWRPYYSGSWSNFLANPGLDAGELSQILDPAPQSGLAQGAPTLTIANVGGQVALNWSTNYADFQLESCSSFNAGQTWSAVTNDPVIVNGSYCVTNNANAASQFYRLRLP